MTLETRRVVFPIVLSALAVFVGVLVAVTAVQISTEFTQFSELAKG